MKRTKQWVLGIGLSFLALLTCCRSGNESIVARVNGLTIRRDEVERLLWERYAGFVTRELVELGLLEREASRRGIVVTGEEITQRAQRRTPSGVFGYLDRTGFYKELLLEKLANALVEVREDELRQYYNSHASEFDEPEAAHLREITLEDKQSAWAIYEALRRLKGTNFEALARHFSVSDLTRRKGGDMGLVPTRDLHPAIRKIVQSLQENQFSKPFPVDDRWMIVKVEKRVPGRKKTYEEVRDFIYGRLRNQKARALQTELVVRPLREAKMEIFDETVRRHLQAGGLIR